MADPDPTDETAASPPKAEQQPDENADGAASVKTADPFSEAQESLLKTPSSIRELGVYINQQRGWSGSNYDDYDVVTVHGIRDDFNTAWTDEQGGWWVKDKLFKDMSVREVDYSYEIDGNSTIYEPNGITVLAENLITGYADVRKKLEDTETDRPILWICHDIGGIIAKEALCLAMRNPARYGKISVLTTMIVFLGVPHRSQSTSDLEDQLCKLILLPGPEIKDALLSKVKNLARQVHAVNQRFLATKLLDRTAIFNLFTHNVRDSLKHIKNADLAKESLWLRTGYRCVDNVHNPATPFSRYAHMVGQPFEAVGRFRLSRVDHLGIIRARLTRLDRWFPWVSNLFNTSGFTTRVKYQFLPLQARLLSLAPPTRALEIPFDPVLPEPDVVAWIYEQEPYTTFVKPGVGLRLLHLHANGNSWVDISDVSHQFYVHYDSAQALRGPGLPSWAVVYFEFDRHDSRYNTISSMLVYLINIFAWRFWADQGDLLREELEFLDEMRAWSRNDLYHIYTTFRNWNLDTNELTIFLGCFDQCPEDERRWFLDRLLTEQSYSDAECRLVLSTSTRDGLATDLFPDEARINLAACSFLSAPQDGLASHLRPGLANLIARRPVYAKFQSQLESLLGECRDTPYLGPIIQNWLAIHHQGKSRREVAGIINKMFPPTPENIVRTFILSLPPALQRTAAKAFNWVKHAAEPWSPESLTEALAIDESDEGEEPSLKDLDAEGSMREIEQALEGIITSKNRNVKFSHPSFYKVSEIGISGSVEERAAKANSAIAETCLRYLCLEAAKEALVEFSLEHCHAALWGDRMLNAAIISHPRTSMAEYAVRFWPHHYKASAPLQPSGLVHRLFANKDARGGWEMPFWLLSNPFTRIHRSYASTLPVFAMLGLEDLVDEKIRAESGQPSFEENCWFAVTEAARAGNEAMVRRLLGEVPSVDHELRTALFWAAARGDANIVAVLLEKIADMGTFQWPKNMLDRAAAAGLDKLLEAMLQCSYDVNKPGIYRDAPPAVVVAWTDGVAAMEVLLNSNHKPDLTVKDRSGDTAFTTAVRKGNPSMIELLLRAGASVTEESRGEGVVQIALLNGKHKAAEILLDSGTGYRDGEKAADYFSRKRLLATAASKGAGCVRVLLDRGADPKLEGDETAGTALYAATTGNHVDVARLLLQHTPKLHIDVAPSGKMQPLMWAVNNRNTELVSLLIEHGAEVDFIDTNCGHVFCKTPLSMACSTGDLDTVKLLLSKGADINYTGGGSDPPLFTALYYDEFDVASYLLQQKKVDVMWTDGCGMNALHVAVGSENIVAVGSEGIVSDLLGKGVPIDSRSNIGTALYVAAKYNEAAVVETLLANDPKPNLDYVYGDDGTNVDEVGYTPLQVSCARGSLDCIPLLLKAGADAKFRNKNGDGAVDILFRTPASGPNSERDVSECLRLLLSTRYGVPVDWTNEKGRGCLHSIEEKTPVGRVQVLVEARTPLDAQDKDGFTPLSVAISKHNESVAKYLIEQGASVNILSPVFGSILHLAVSKGELGLVKLLVASGAELEAVDREYGESLLYTALGIQDVQIRVEMVRYLVDEARAPVNKLGGTHYSYPIIRAAANLAGSTDTCPDDAILKFLIRSGAHLDVADSQGRRAVHFACRALFDAGIRALAEAHAELDVADRFGRRPVHFAASTGRYNFSAYMYLLNKLGDVEVDVKDEDNWTPLMWAARSNAASAIEALVSRGADLWARGSAYGAENAWSAPRLLNFANGSSQLKDCLQPKERMRTKPDGETEEWDDSFHKSRPGHRKNVECKSCLVKIVGTEWKCIECPVHFSLCFKCYRLQPDYHAPAHSFEEIGPMYDGPPPASPGITSKNGSDDGAGLSTDALGGEEGGADAEQLGPASPDDLEFVLDDESVVE